jgi:Inosine-uridine preferring nucleoside hydrolase
MSPGSGRYWLSRPRRPEVAAISSSGSAREGRVAAGGRRSGPPGRRCRRSGLRPAQRCTRRANGRLSSSCSDSPYFESPASRSITFAGRQPWGRECLGTFTDMASDDIMALSYLLEVPGISVQAVTVEGTGEAHGPAGARNALRLMRSLGVHRPIPVGYGPPNPVSGFRSFPPAWRKAADGMYNLNLPAWQGPQPSESAVRLLVDTISRSARPVELITLGPLTNVALALHADPGLASKIARVVSMAGALRVDGNEPFHQRAEWNV